MDATCAGKQRRFKPWETSRQLFGRLWPFFVTMFENNWSSYSELFQQLLYSARLFRRASEMGSYGLEYLCKWVAIEALVIAGTTTDKGLLVAERVSSLFPNRRDVIRARKCVICGSVGTSSHMKRNRNFFTKLM
jgi:hypothetical protein